MRSLDESAIQAREPPTARGPKLPVYQHKPLTNPGRRVAVAAAAGLDRRAVLVVVLVVIGTLFGITGKRSLEFTIALSMRNNFLHK